WEIIRLEVYNKKVRVGRRRDGYSDAFRVGFYTMTIPEVGAAAYLLSRAAAQKLCELPLRVDYPVDLFLFNKFIRSAHDLEILQSAPALAVQHHNHPDASPDYLDDSDLNGRRSDAGIVSEGRYRYSLPKNKFVKEIVRPLLQIEYWIYRKYIVSRFDPSEYPGGPVIEFFEG
ncbi:MAG: hypothetical protein AAFR27_08100, partial [Pseudomonadota bacterium]